MKADPSKFLTWDQLKDWRWGPARHDPEPGIQSRGAGVPDEHTWRSMQRDQYAIEERAAIKALM